MTTNNYKCTQPELYAVARTGWSSYSAFLAAFEAFRGFYDAAYATAAGTEIDDAEALPDSQARYANSEVLRTELVALADTLLGEVWGAAIEAQPTSSFVHCSLPTAL